ncbi:STAS domain-containing protein [Microvirga sp. 0TCS3.31]
MELREESRDGILIVQVCSRRIDASKAPQLKEELTKRVQPGQTKLVLDFSMVNFIDSIGLGALVSCLKWLGNREQLIIVGATAAVQRLFAQTRMDRVFALYPFLEAVLADKPRNFT